MANKENDFMNSSVETARINVKNSVTVEENESLDFTKFTKNIFRTNNSLIRECLAEILSTFVLITFGCGSVAQHVFGRQTDTLSVNFSWGFAVTAGILVGGNVSGAHMNPAVSFAMLVLGKINALKFLLYVLAQSIGAFLGSVVVYVTYLDALRNFDGGFRAVFGANATAGIWATYPQPYLSISGAFIDNIVGTGLLVLVCLAVGDSRNPKINNQFAAILMGITVALIGMTFGQNCGYPINPVRDFIPRLFTSMAGWGSDVYSAYNYYFWVPIVGPIIGAVLSAYIYALFIRNHWPEENDQKVLQVQYVHQGK